MNTIYYDHVIDMENSEAFAQGFYDSDKHIIYLVFTTGHPVARKAYYNDADLEEVESWGSEWHTNLKFCPYVEVEEPVEFVPRPAQDENVDDYGITVSDHHNRPAPALDEVEGEHVSVSFFGLSPENAEVIRHAAHAFVEFIREDIPSVHHSITQISGDNA